MDCRRSGGSGIVEAEIAGGECVVETGATRGNVGCCGIVDGIVKEGMADVGELREDDHCGSSGIVSEDLEGNSKERN